LLVAIIFHNFTIDIYNNAIEFTNVILATCNLKIFLLDCFKYTSALLVIIYKFIHGTQSLINISGAFMVHHKYKYKCQLFIRE